MRYLKLSLALLAVGGFAGCRKPSPTSYMRAYSIFIKFPDRQVSWHRFSIASVSPSFVPEVRFNGRKIPRENIDESLGEFSGWDNLPTISPNAEVQMEVKYRDLNEHDGFSSSYNFKDTIITDIENVTEVSRTLGTMCAPISNPVAVFAEGTVANFYGPWSGSKDNIKGIRGQYYGGSGVFSFASWPPSSRVEKFDGKFNLNKEEFFKRMINTIEKHFGVQDEGSWINGF